MNRLRHGALGVLCSLLVVGFAAFVMQRFLLPLVWAGILCIATWPLYRRLLALSGGRTILVASLLATSMACILALPALLGLQQAIEQAPVIADFIVTANNNGIAPPLALQRVPLAGDYIVHWWLATLAQPHGLLHLLSDGSLNRLHSASDVLKSLGSQLFHRVVDFGFALLCLFFFYKDGQTLHQQIMQIGGHCFGDRRWNSYSRTIPTAIRATVNGLVLVGLGEGVLIGIGYAIAGLSSLTLWTAITGMLAIIPFGAPIAYLSAAALLAGSGNTGMAIGIATWGTIVLFCADHLIRPHMIGNATRLPFLAVLFGILGGVETFGLVGLFIGPVLMALLITLWRAESSNSEQFLVS